MKRKMDFPEVAGKTVEAVALYDDSVYGREMTMRFEDGTELSVTLSVEQTAHARFFQRATGETVAEHQDEEAPLPVIEL